SATMTQLKAAVIAGVDLDPNLTGLVSSNGRLNAYRSLQALIGNQVPVGSVDSIANGKVTGWAFDFNAGANPINVSVYIDGTLFTTVSANRIRPDLQTAVGSTAHGFSVNLPALSFGTHNIQVFAVNTPGGGNVLLPNSGPTAIRPALFDETFYLAKYAD